MNSTRDFNWIHFSDLHIEPQPGFDSEQAKRTLLSCLSKEIGNGNLAPDYIFITGDVAHQGDYGNVSTFLNKLFGALEWSPKKMDRVFWAVGNHDLFRENKLRNEIICKILRKEKDGDKLFDEYMKDGGDFFNIFTSLDMRVFAETHQALLKRAPCQNPNSPHNLHKLINLNLIVLNTCLTSCDDCDEGNLLIAESHLFSPFDDIDRANPTFVIGHHGQEFFSQNSKMKLGNVFDENGVDLYLCGHSHLLGCSEFSQAGRDLYQITCGGVIVDGYSRLAFMYGCYNSKTHTVNIRPYSYIETGKWQPDDSLHRRTGSDKQIELTGPRVAPKPIRIGPILNPSESVRIDVRNDWSSSFFGPEIPKRRGE